MRDLSPSRTPLIGRYSDEGFERRDQVESSLSRTSSEEVRSNEFSSRLLERSSAIAEVGSNDDSCFLLRISDPKCLKGVEIGVCVLPENRSADVRRVAEL